jgi:hypothetical protein
VATWLNEGFENASDGTQVSTSTTTFAGVSGIYNAGLTHSSGSANTGAISMKWDPRSGYTYGPTGRNAFGTKASANGVNQVSVRFAFQMLANPTRGQQSYPFTLSCGFTRDVNFYFVGSDDPYGVYSAVGTKCIFVLGNYFDTSLQLLTPFTATLGQWYTIDVEIKRNSSTSHTFTGRRWTGTSKTEEKVFTRTETVSLLGGSSIWGCRYPGYVTNGAYYLDSLLGTNDVLPPLVSNQWGVGQVRW